MKVFNGERFSGTAKFCRISDGRDTGTINANAFTLMKCGKLGKRKFTSINITSCSKRPENLTIS